MASQVPMQQSSIRAGFVGPGEREGCQKAHGSAVPVSFPSYDKSHGAEAMGSASGTCVEDHDDGERLERNLLCSWPLELDGFAMATRQYIKGQREEEIKGPPMAKPLLSFSPENTFKRLPATAPGKAGLEGNAEVTLKAGRGLSHNCACACAQTHTDTYTYHTGRHTHLGHLFLLGKCSLT